MGQALLKTCNEAVWIPWFSKTSIPYNCLGMGLLGLFCVMRQNNELFSVFVMLDHK